jgi:predicted ATPase
MVTLSRLRLRGWKSYGAEVDLALGGTNVLIGANGAGKSNLISFFEMLSWMTTSPGQLQEYIARHGFAEVLLHEGSHTTQCIAAGLTFETDRGVNDYEFRLAAAAGDTLVFTDERYRYTPREAPARPAWRELEAGQREARIVAEAERGDPTARLIVGLLQRCKVYHFHDTSESAGLRKQARVGDNHYLRQNLANLAPVLLRLYEDQPRYYQRIVELLRLVLPFFADFEFGLRNGTLGLRWRERGSDAVYAADQGSDGTLRIMGLVTLLLQPAPDLPNLLLVDEPELGLHPYALDVVGGLLQDLPVQLLCATQSPALLDHFAPEQVLVADRTWRNTALRRLSGQALADWLADYTLSELWDKNVLGGRPARWSA